MSLSLAERGTGQSLAHFLTQEGAWCYQICTFQGEDSSFLPEETRGTERRGSRTSLGAHMELSSLWLSSRSNGGPGCCREGVVMGIRSREVSVSTHTAITRGDHRGSEKRGAPSRQDRECSRGEGRGGVSRPAPDSH